MPEYMEDESGVHVMNPHDEGTLCGTFDSRHNDLRKTRKKVVTCRVCIRNLKDLQSVKYREGEGHEIGQK